MSGPSEPKRQPTHDPAGGTYHKAWPLLIVGGTIFLLAWIVWTFWLGASLL